MIIAPWWCFSSWAVRLRWRLELLQSLCPCTASLDVALWNRLARSNWDLVCFVSCGTGLPGGLCHPAAAWEGDRECAELCRSMVWRYLVFVWHLACAVLLRHQGSWDMFACVWRNWIFLWCSYFKGLKAWFPLHWSLLIVDASRITAYRRPFSCLLSPRSALLCNPCFPAAVHFWTWGGVNIHLKPKGGRDLE